MKCKNCKFYIKPILHNAKTGNGSEIVFSNQGMCNLINYYLTLSDPVMECPAFEKKDSKRKKPKSKKATNENLYKDCIIHNK